MPRPPPLPLLSPLSCAARKYEGLSYAKHGRGMVTPDRRPVSARNSRATPPVGLTPPAQPGLRLQRSTSAFEARPMPRGQSTPPLVALSSTHQTPGRSSTLPPGRTASGRVVPMVPRADIPVLAFPHSAAPSTNYATAAEPTSRGVDSPLSSASGSSPLHRSVSLARRVHNPPTYVEFPRMPPVELPYIDRPPDMDGDSLATPAEAPSVQLDEASSRTTSEQGANSTERITPLRTPVSPGLSLPPFTAAPMAHLWCRLLTFHSWVVKMSIMGELADEPQVQHILSLELVRW